MNEEVSEGGKGGAGSEMDGGEGAKGSQVVEGGEGAEGGQVVEGGEGAKGGQVCKGSQVVEGGEGAEGGQNEGIKSEDNDTESNKVAPGGAHDSSSTCDVTPMLEDQSALKVSNKKVNLIAENRAIKIITSNDELPHLTMKSQNEKVICKSTIFITLSQRVTLPSSQSEVKDPPSKSTPDDTLKSASQVTPSITQFKTTLICPSVEVTSSNIDNTILLNEKTDSISSEDQNIQSSGAPNLTLTSLQGQSSTSASSPETTSYCLQEQIEDFTDEMSSDDQDTQSNGSSELTLMPSEGQSSTSTSSPETTSYCLQEQIEDFTDKNDEISSDGQDTQSNRSPELTLKPSEGQNSSSTSSLERTFHYLQEHFADFTTLQSEVSLGDFDTQSNESTGLTLTSREGQSSTSNDSAAVTLNLPQGQISQSNNPFETTLNYTQGSTPSEMTLTSIESQISSPSKFLPETTSNLEQEQLKDSSRPSRKVQSYLNGPLGTLNDPSLEALKQQPQVKFVPECVDFELDLGNIKTFNFSMENQGSTKMQLGLQPLEGVEIAVVERNPQKISLHQQKKGIFRVLGCKEKYKVRITVRLNPSVWENKIDIQFPLAFSIHADMRSSLRGNSIFFVLRYKNPFMFPNLQNADEKAEMYQNFFGSDLTISHLNEELKTSIATLGADHEATKEKAQKLLSYLLSIGKYVESLSTADFMFREHMLGKENMDENGYQWLVNKISCVEHLQFYNDAWNLRMFQLDYVKKTNGNVFEILEYMCKIACNLCTKGEMEYIEKFITICKNILSIIKYIDIHTSPMYLHSIVTYISEYYSTEVAIDLYDILHYTLAKSYGISNFYTTQILIHKAQFLDSKFISPNNDKEVSEIYSNVYHTQVHFNEDTSETLIAMCQSAVRFFVMNPTSLTLSKWFVFMKETLSNPNADRLRITYLLRKIAIVIFSNECLKGNNMNYDELFRFSTAKLGGGHYITLELLMNKGDMISLFGNYSWFAKDSILRIYNLVHKIATKSQDENSYYVELSLTKINGFKDSLEKSFQDLMDKKKDDSLNLVVYQNMARFAVILDQFDRPNSWNTLLKIFNRKPKTSTEIYHQSLIMSQVAKDLMQNGKQIYALSIYEKIIKKMISAYGAADIKTLLAKRDIAECLYLLNRFDEALTYLTDVIKRGKYKISLGSKNEKEENVKILLDQLPGINDNAIL